MAQELGVPHTLDSAAEVIIKALTESDQVDTVTVLGAGTNEDGSRFIQLRVAAHLVDGAKFTTTVDVS